MTPTPVPQQSEDVEPVTRSLRSAAKMACEKIKVRRRIHLFAFWRSFNISLKLEKTKEGWGLLWWMKIKRFFVNMKLLWYESHIVNGSYEIRHFSAPVFHWCVATKELGTTKEDLLTILPLSIRNPHRRDFTDKRMGFVFSLQVSVATRKWNKEVDRSLYSSRAYASKNPTLSPIKERRSFIPQPPVTESKSAGCIGDMLETIILMYRPSPRYCIFAGLNFSPTVFRWWHQLEDWTCGARKTVWRFRGLLLHSRNHHGNRQKTAGTGEGEVQCWCPAQCGDCGRNGGWARWRTNSCEPRSIVGTPPRTHSAWT